MRGCDGWAYGELKLLPVASLDVLAKIFVAIEQGAPWPTALSQWFLVLLRKGERPCPVMGPNSSYFSLCGAVQTLGTDSCQRTAKDTVRSSHWTY